MANSAYAPSGALFSVDEEKRKSEKSPHYQGTVSYTHLTLPTILLV